MKFNNGAYINTADGRPPREGVDLNIAGMFTVFIEKGRPPREGVD